LNEFENFKVKFVGIYAGNSIEWALIDIACAYYGFTTVPIYDTLGEEASKEMFEQTNLTTLFLTSVHLEGIITAIKKGGCGKLKNIIIMDEKRMKYLPDQFNQVEYE